MSNPGWPFPPKKSACGKLVSSNKACQSRGVVFAKKSACGKIPISNRACQIQGGHFHRKKSACGKLVSSDRACQVGSVPCQVGSASAPIRVVPCQAPSVSVRAVPCPVRSLRVSASVSCRRHPGFCLPSLCLWAGKLVSVEPGSVMAQ